MGTSDRFSEVAASTSLKDYAESHLERARAGHPYVCPFCGSGGHGKANSDSAFAIRGERFKCYNCKNHGDIFDLAGAVNGTDNRNEELRLVAEFAGVDVPEYEPDGPEPTASRPETKKQTKKPEKKPSLSLEAIQALKKKNAAYVERCRQALAGSPGVEYLASRGVSPEQAERHRIGWDSYWKAVTIPTGNGLHSVARTVEGKNYRNIVGDRAQHVEGLDMAPLCLRPLEGTDCLVIVEGPFDALAVERAGYPAAATLGSAGLHKLPLLLAKHHYTGKVLVMLDDDSQNPTASESTKEENQRNKKELLAALKEQGLDARLVEQVPGHKDAGDTPTEELAAHLSRQLHADEWDGYRQSLAALGTSGTFDTADRILNLSDAVAPIPTGFTQLDEALDGGLVPGLYTLGAVSSMGKTTFLLQLADQIAAQGYPVLFVTIEQSRKELVAKSLSRILSLNGMPATTTQITRPKSRLAFAVEQTRALEEAVELYKEQIAPWLLVMEPDEAPSVADIRRAAELIREKTNGRAPVIFVDYLQLLAKDDPRTDDTSAVALNVSRLRKLTKPDTLGVPVVTISSLNRDSYADTMKLSSFKQTGQVEYASDVLIGEQAGGVWEAAKTSKDQAAARARIEQLTSDCKEASVREVEFVILKNRNGALPDCPIEFDFVPAESRFVEPGTDANLRRIYSLPDGGTQEQAERRKEEEAAAIRGAIERIQAMGHPARITDITDLTELPRRIVKQRLYETGGGFAPDPDDPNAWTIDEGRAYETERLELDE